MSNPNKTVAAFRKKNPFPPRPHREITDPFMLFIFEQAKAGVVFDNEVQAREAFQTTQESKP